MELMGQLGISLWSVFFIVPTGRARPSDLATADEFERVFHRPYDIGSSPDELPRELATTAVDTIPRRTRDFAERGIAKEIFPVDNHADGAYLYLDQFWMSNTLGNVRDRKFSEIWQDISDPLVAGLRDRAPLLRGRCNGCQWKDVCGGSFRVRAFQVHGDPWAEDPGCYLTDDECGLTPGSRIREPVF